MKLYVLFLVTLALTATAATEETKENLVESESQVERVKEREDTTEKASPQVVLPYNPSGTRGLVYPANTYVNRFIPTGVYPNGVYPNNVNLYNSNNPASNPAYNPSASPTNYYPSSYNPTVYTPTVYNPTSLYPTRTNGGGYLGNGLTEAFTARRAVPYTNAGSKIIFTETVTQVGTGWNTARSEFVATTPGLFFFTFSAVSGLNSHFRISLSRNGLDVANAFGDANGYQMGSQSAVLSLSSGDRVYLRLQEGTIHEASSSRAYTSFTGFRIL